MQILRRVVLPFSIFALLMPVSAPAKPMSEDALKAEISDIRKRTTSDFAHISGYTNILKNPDLTGEQTAMVLRYRASARSGNGDDKLGAIADYARIRDEFPATRHYENAVSQYAYTYGQMYYMTKRALAATIIDEDVIGDIWGLGYWDNAIDLAKDRNTTIVSDTPLLQDMYEAGYLCEIAVQGNTPRFAYNLDNKQYNLDFCPDGTPLKYKSPQSVPAANFGTAIQDLHAKAIIEKG